MIHIVQSHALLDQVARAELRLVLVESPLASPMIEGWVRHKKFARACARDCLARGEAPFASHLFYAQEGLVDDDIAHERALGIHAGLLWGSAASLTVVYGDLGISSGMAKGIERAIAEGRLIEYRKLGHVPEVTAKEIALEELRREVDRECKAEPRFAPLSLDFTPMAKARMSEHQC